MYVKVTVGLDTVHKGVKVAETVAVPVAVAAIAGKVDAKNKPVVSNFLIDMMISS